MKITKYDEAFDLIGITPNDKINSMIKRLEIAGRKEKNICYAIWKGKDKIISFRGDSRFYSILENEIKKWCFGKNDPRWEEYNRKIASGLI